MKPRDVLNLSRLHTANWEALVFVLGPLMTRSSDYTTIAVLAVLGIAINAFIFVLNDLADLPRDRMNPARSGSPLVSERVSPAFALAVSCALPSAMWMAVALDGWTRMASVAFATLLLLGTYLDVYQKASPRIHPLILDSLFGVTMAGPIPVGAAAVREELTPAIWLTTVGFGLLCVLLNAVGGNLKDLRSDAETGFLTTALAFGVRATDRGLEFTSAYRVFAYSFVAAMAPLLTLAAALSERGYLVRAAGAVVTAVLCFGALTAVQRLLSGARPPSARGREPFFAYGMGAVLVVAAVHANPGALALALALCVLWEIAFRLYWSREAPIDAR